MVEMDTVMMGWSVVLRVAETVEEAKVQEAKEAAAVDTVDMKETTVVDTVDTKEETGAAQAAARAAAEAAACAVVAVVVANMAV